LSASTLLATAYNQYTIVQSTGIAIFSMLAAFVFSLARNNDPAHKVDKHLRKASTMLESTDN